MTVVENYKLIKPTFTFKRVPTSVGSSLPFVSIDDANTFKPQKLVRDGVVSTEYIDAQLKKQAEIEGILIDNRGKSVDIARREMGADEGQEQ